MRERGAVALDGGFGIVRSEPQVECIAAVGAGRTAQTGGESVDEPGKCAEVRGAKNCEFVLLGDPLRHLPMLTDATDGSSGRSES
jgi:hypothetical protein